MIVVMAGLPGTGKSTLAYALESRLPAIVINKDVARAALFPIDKIEYSARQDDFVISIMVQVADYYIRNGIAQNIILDGRTFMKEAQVDAVVDYCRIFDWDLRTVFCTCSDDVARSRIEADAASGKHLAADRDFNLYLRLKSGADELQVPHLRVDTGESLEFCIQSCLDYLNTDPD